MKHITMSKNAKLHKFLLKWSEEYRDEYYNGQVNTCSLLSSLLLVLVTKLWTIFVVVYLAGISGDILAWILCLITTGYVFPAVYSAIFMGTCLFALVLILISGSYDASSFTTLKESFYAWKDKVCVPVRITDD